MSCASASASVRSLVELQHARQGARDLRHFDGVRQAVAEMVRQARREDLGLGFEPPESARMNHAVAIPLEGVAVSVTGLGGAGPAYK